MRAIRKLGCGGNEGPESSAAALFGRFLIQTLSKKHLEQGLVRHIAFVGQLFQARNDRNRQAQRDRPHGRLWSAKTPPTANSPM
jgi:hypothetical protein